jgi:hypothetical protein
MLSNPLRGKPTFATSQELVIAGTRLEPGLACPGKGERDLL